MKVNSFYPVLMTNTVEQDAEFYSKYLAFNKTYSSDWYISLIDAYDNELAILDVNHETVPHGFAKTTSGVILNIEVENVDEVYQSLISSKESKIVLDMKIEEFGQKHFIIAGPNNILIDIIEVIPATGEYVGNYE
ncbi:VOC family protein [Mammaliicoccus sciuri]|uniref:VOC family protein n=1 Tax=Mammaliicoccus sciuri TaxID=1296 RepID=UPI003AE0DE5D